MVVGVLWLGWPDDARDGCGDVLLSWLVYQRLLLLLIDRRVHFPDGLLFVPVVTAVFVTESLTSRDLF